METDETQAPAAAGSAGNRKKWVIAACLLLCAALGAVILVLVTNSKVARNKQRAIDLVKEYLDAEDPILRSSMFESWDASGDSSMMEVRATYYPRNIEGFREVHTGDALHTLKWQVNLNTGSVNLKEDVDPDG